MQLHGPNVGRIDPARHSGGLPLTYRLEIFRSGDGRLPLLPAWAGTAADQAPAPATLAISARVAGARAMPSTTERMSRQRRKVCIAAAASFWAN